MKQHIEIPLSENKRHFVVGDIHGRYDTFINLLEEINYDETTDMIYSVGDLIDRGPKVVEVVEFKEEVVEVKEEVVEVKEEIVEEVVEVVEVK